MTEIDNETSSQSILDSLELLIAQTSTFALLRRFTLCILLIFTTAFLPNGWRSPPQNTAADSSNWEHWDEGLPSFAPVLSLAVDPEHPTTLYAGTYSLPGLWHSTDGGGTWEWEGQAEDLAGPHNHPVFSLLSDNKHQGWWAGTSAGLFFRSATSSDWQPVADLDEPTFALWLDEAGRVYAVQAGEGLFRLEEENTWTCIRQEPRALTVATSPTGRHVFLGTAGNGLWVSHDSGEKWLQVPEWQEEYITALMVDRDKGRRVYASTSSQVYHSEDFGRTWQPIPELDDHVYAFAVAPDGALYAGLTGRVARSQDSGQTWGFPGEGDTGLNLQMPVLDLVAAHQPGDGYVLYAATREGVYRSIDRGKTWQRHQKGLGRVEVKALAWDGEGGILAATLSGLYRRPRGHDQWESTAPAFRHKHFYALSNNDSYSTIYAGMQSGLVRTTDGGKTWEEVISDLTPTAMPGVLVDPEDANHVFIRLAFERVYESHDGGKNWEARWEGMETHHVVLSMTRSPSGQLWAGTQDGLFSWDRQRDLWERHSLPLENQSIFAIAFDSEGKTGYVGATRGLLCRQDGNHWHHCAARTIDQTVTSLAVLPNGHVYAGTRYAGLYKSCDQGYTWQQVSDIPADCSINALLADTEENTIYVATDRGLFRGGDAACPPSETSPGGGIREESADHIWLKRMLSLSRRYPQVGSLPAVHTLRADDSLLRQAKDIGFRTVVQVLSWEETEPTQGEWHWEYPDFLVRSADFYGLDLVIRLDHPPEWAMQAKEVAAGGHTTPFDVDAYLRFIEAVTKRYQGRIQGYIIWNEPNLAAEWGAAPDPVAYTKLLQRAYIVVKQNDPFALVISAGLAPTNTGTQTSTGVLNEEAMDDRAFLEAMYQAGARPFFDALGAHPYGFAYPPDDPPGAHGGLNMNRLLDLRTIMEANGDGSKTVWATEVGWTTQGRGEHAWLTVTPQEQADYLVSAWSKTRDEFPWLRGFTVWNLSRGLPEGDEKAGYSLLYGDGTPKPACEALQETFSSADIGSNVPDPARVLNSLLPPSSRVFILGQDEEVHLGDSE